jgi:hypothetical protein
MTFIKQIKDHWDDDRKEPKLIYLGNTARPWGINEADTWWMDGHMAAVLANGLRMLVAYGHCVRDEEQYEYIASKLEFYACDPEITLYDYIDWSKDENHGEMLTDEKGIWISPKGQPGFDEYCEKAEVIKEIQIAGMKEALAWLADHWAELWD